ncbi:hypothetical protein ACFSVK_08650 [Azorhizophilus paspali]|uniref:hypothetical protein n=1 Tax=Azorhizophilus paspali TaxID=69963 RepID=UPI00363F0DEE
MLTMGWRDPRLPSAMASLTCQSRDVSVFSFTRKCCSLPSMKILFDLYMLGLGATYEEAYTNEVISLQSGVSSGPDCIGKTISSESK